ncbi:MULTISPECIES: hypothetical protein [unclassified Bartonella]|uniref:hypothetical protein n=1 Tax=unclassified Bartonella TaxID=2645622 RepID=UPI0035CEF93D
MIKNLSFWRVFSMRLASPPARKCALLPQTPEYLLLQVSIFRSQYRLVRQIFMLDKRK